MSPTRDYGRARRVSNSGWRTGGFSEWLRSTELSKTRRAHIMRNQGSSWAGVFSVNGLFFGRRGSFRPGILVWLNLGDRPGHLVLGLGVRGPISSPLAIAGFRHFRKRTEIRGRLPNFRRDGKRDEVRAFSQRLLGVGSGARLESVENCKVGRMQNKPFQFDCLIP